MTRIPELQAQLKVAEAALTAAQASAPSAAAAARREPTGEAGPPACVAQAAGACLLRRAGMAVVAGPTPASAEAQPLQNGTVTGAEATAAAQPPEQDSQLAEFQVGALMTPCCCSRADPEQHEFQITRLTSSPAPRLAQAAKTS